MELSEEIFSSKVISQFQLGNYMGLNIFPYLYIRFLFGQRIPLLIELNTVSSGIVIIV
jgi:hypothetical protein